MQSGLKGSSRPGLTLTGLFYCLFGAVVESIFLYEVVNDVRDFMRIST